MTKYVNNNGVSEMWTNTKNYISAQLLGKSDVGHTHSASDITSGLATVATSGSYEDLSNKPTIPTVNNATLTIQKNSSNVATFTANASSNVTANILVPTKVSELTNDSGFITSSGSCNYANSAGYVQGNNNSANAANALLRSGSGRTDSSPEGDTWIFLDELGGSGTPWGFKHNQGANTIGFYAGGTETSSINLSNGYFSGSCNYANSAGSAGSVAWGNVSGRPSFATVATSGSYNDLTDKPTIPVIDSALESLGANSIPFHNSYPRCKYLGTTITDAQNTAIKTRTYDDLFIGDYWTINGVNWRIVAIDYYYNVGDTNFDKGNIIVMPDAVLYNAQMNTGNGADGSYTQSLMRRQNLNSARTIAQNAFGSHLANHRILLEGYSGYSGPSGWVWYNSDGVELPNEVQIYGTRDWGTRLNTYYMVTQKQQFPLLALAPQFVNIRQTYWLREIYSYPTSNNPSLYFVAAYAGSAGPANASSSFGVRPSVTLSYI